MVRIHQGASFKSQSMTGLGRFSTRPRPGLSRRFVQNLVQSGRITLSPGGAPGPQHPARVNSLGSAWLNPTGPQMPEEKPWMITRENNPKRAGLPPLDESVDGKMFGVRLFASDAEMLRSLKVQPSDFIRNAVREALNKIRAADH